MEAEIRAILAEAVGAPDPNVGLFGTLLDRMAQVDGVEPELPSGRSVRAQLICRGDRPRHERGFGADAALAVEGGRRQGAGRARVASGT